MKHIPILILTILTILSCKNKAELDAQSAKSRAKTSQMEEAADSNSQAEDEAHTKKENLTTAEAIAYANGLEHWDTVNEIQFTFNVDNGENHSERSWIWKPQTDDVSLIQGEDTIAYNRNSIDSTSLKADQAFINDKYWLHAPFNLVWDEGTTISEKENVIAPMSKDTLNQLTIVYNDDLGYTPGDAYDLYYDNDFKVREWVFRKGNQEEPSMATTWEDYQNFDGIKLAKMHKDESGGFKLYFTDLKVKTDKASAHGE